MKYKVSGRFAEIGPGLRIGLSPAQASSRQHVLEDCGGGFFVATAVLQFKSGETIDLDIPPFGLPRALAVVLAPIVDAVRAESAPRQSRRQEA